MDIDDLKYVAKTYGTPLYIFNLEVLKAHIKLIRELLDKRICLCFAIKANPFLVKEMDSLVDKYEVCSPGEFSICEREKIDSQKIVLSGVNKEKEKFDYLLKNKQYRGIITVESHNQLDMLNECALKNKCKIEVLLRLTSGNQFGMDENTITDIIKNRDSLPNITILGIQYYSGTQKKNMKKIEKELHYLDEFCLSLKNNCRYEVVELEYGPGLLVPNFMDMRESYDAGEMLTALNNSLNSMKFKANITLEMGRFLTAFCGEYLTTIVDKKCNNDKKYCIVDGGLNHVNFYGQVMGMRTPIYKHIMMTGLDNADSLKKKEPVSGQDVLRDKKESWDICGSLCTVNDVLVRELPLENVNIGDIIVFKNVGAYSMTEGMSLFLSRDLPKIITYSGEQGFNVKREAYAIDLINSHSACK